MVTELMSVGWVAVDAVTHTPHRRLRKGYSRSQPNPPKIYTSEANALLYAPEGFVALQVYVPTPNGI